jgi:hypothetical protein
MKEIIEIDFVDARHWHDVFALVADHVQLADMRRVTTRTNDRENLKTNTQKEKEKGTSP